MCERPPNGRAQPVGLLLGALLVGGVYGAASLRKSIGKSHLVMGEIVSVAQ